MLPDITESELDIFNAQHPEGAHKALLRMRRVFSKRSAAHLRSQRIYTLCYHLFGSVAAILSVTLAALDPCANASYIFGVALTIAILTTGLNFFGIESRMQKHDMAKSQYDSLALEIEKHMLTSSDLMKEAVNVERSMFDRAKMIAVIEPDLSLCCLPKG